jgi:Icc-related predicted phosphoesterase
MKILFTSDLHGEIPLYHQALEIASGSSATILILGGDLLPALKMSRRYEDMIQEQQSFIAAFLLPFFKRCLKTDVRQILLIPGNWDPAYPEIFVEPVEGLIDLDRKSLQLENGHEIIGYPFVPPTPFRPKDYEKMDDLEAPWPPQKNPSYIRSPGSSSMIKPIDPHEYLRKNGTIAEDLEKISPGKDGHKAIWVMHSPPRGTNLDVIYGGQSVGSRSIRRFIETFQPLMTMHGHIHEAPRLSGNYADWVGNTLCINPGQLLSEDEGFPRLQGVIFDLHNPEKTITHTGFKRE